MFGLVVIYKKLMQRGVILIIDLKTVTMKYNFTNWNTVY